MPTDCLINGLTRVLYETSDCYGTELRGYTLPFLWVVTKDLDNAHNLELCTKGGDISIVLQTY